MISDDDYTAIVVSDDSSDDEPSRLIGEYTAIGNKTRKARSPCSTQLHYHGVDSSEAAAWTNSVP